MKFRWETEFKETEIGEIPREWEVKLLGDNSIFTIIMGQSPPSEFYNQNKIGIPFVQGKGEFGEVYVETKTYTTKCNKIAPRNSVLITVRAPVGELNLSKENICIGRGVASLSFKNHDVLKNKFLYYSLKHLKEQLSMIGERGTTYDSVTIEELTNFQIPLPPPSEQSRIATVLAWFDDLIENKKRQNEILEKVAMALFKNWFIDFEPFKNEEFVYNEDLGKEIPKGWEVKSIGEIAKFTNGLSYKGEEKSEEFMNGSFLFVTLNNIREGGGFKTEYSFIKSDRVKEKHFVREGDVILANTEQTKTGRLLGSPAIVIFPSDYNQSLGVYSHHITKILPVREYYKIFLYLIFKIFQQDIAQTYHTGTGVWGFDIVSFQENFLMCSPPPHVLKSFHSLVEPIFQKIILNQKQIMLLRKIRDRLLPFFSFWKIKG